MENEIVGALGGLLVGMYLGIALMTYLHTPKGDPHDGDE